MAEFFDRGAKIGDSSNRYEHTCKRCGEQFPRGRSETMVIHLTKKCPSLSRTERTKIVLRLHDLAHPDVHPNVDETFDQEAEAGIGHSSQLTSDRPLAAGPNGQQNFDGLNVLAEASRQVGTHPTNNHKTANAASPRRGKASNAQTRTHVPAGLTLPLDPQLEDEAFPEHLLNDDGIGVRANGMSAYIQIRVYPDSSSAD